MSELDVVADRLGALAQRDAPLGSRTTYRVGGPAGLLVDATSDVDLARVAAALAGTDVAVLVLGRGSNLLVADRGFPGLVVTLGEGFARIGEPEAEGDRALVRAGGAVALPTLARTLAERGLGGLEWAVGVPGSVGGAVRMNAGGHGDDTAHCLVDAEVVDLATGTLATLGVDELGFAYRRSGLSGHEVVTSARFAVRPGDAAASARAIAEVVRWRREHQPGGTNAGSVFKNPPDDAAGRLVEAAGLKGHRLGTAQVSPKHANFIQADRGGRADDVAALIELVRATVREREGVTLETEVMLVGFER